MANQYTGNFELVIKDRFNCSAEEVLLKCQKQGLSYLDAEKVLGFKHVTIRKWAKRFDIKLPARFRAQENELRENQSEEAYINKCKSQKVSASNIFSRFWINMKLYSAIKAKP
ncbi:hypothetical protein IB642_01310 [Allofrancisella guangzhouensis]|uniref:Uncharacterized protein n=1 Tax=Allofrancisella guangzhouensis TaxID=594679 RepID=A0A0A8EB98_9GAMM|nr:hypothetical protein [Allofrancisella guangzhouensis]AJC49441.1 hypothetical protein SD28_07325 [Allofrancisella guangzhouensis]MBK2026732.1 hypothetical protein [Allofrancisella guangzhouensis]MBK2043657.1 hypothetical protein [Allofrancisella guangzhouensis]MBK2046188.1 hypothetical protein [Allofrancisella guangzhouensis]